MPGRVIKIPYAGRTKSPVGPRQILGLDAQLGKFLPVSRSSDALFMHLTSKVTPRFREFCPIHFFPLDWDAEF